MSSHSVGRSTYVTSRHPLYLYVQNRGKKRWVRLTGGDRVSNGRRVLSEELSWGLNKAWFWKQKCEDGRQSGYKHSRSNAPSQTKKWSVGEKQTVTVFILKNSSTHWKPVTARKEEKISTNKMPHCVDMLCAILTFDCDLVSVSQVTFNQFWVCISFLMYSDLCL